MTKYPFTTSTGSGSRRNRLHPCRCMIPAPAAYLDKVASGLKARTDEMARAVQVGGPIWHWGNFAKVARNFEWEKRVGNSLVVREAIGVVGCITPWNFLLSQITLKIAPALAAGCTVVLKPSEIAPVNAMILAEITEDVADSKAADAAELRSKGKPTVTLAQLKKECGL